VIEPAFSELVELTSTKAACALLGKPRATHYASNRPAETGELAEAFIADALSRHGIDRDQLILHADRGTSMTSKPVAQLLVDLGVARSHSRPHVSNDNPYSEANFKTSTAQRSPAGLAPSKTPGLSVAPSSITTTMYIATPGSACTRPPRSTTAPPPKSATSGPARSTPPTPPTRPGSATAAPSRRSYPPPPGSTSPAARRSSNPSEKLSHRA
jgi:putative transposase